MRSHEVASWVAPVPRMRVLVNCSNMEVQRFAHHLKFVNVVNGPLWPVGKIRVKTCHIAVLV